MARLTLLLLVAFGTIPAPLRAANLEAAEIMARVAANQDRAVEQRKNFVYHQTARVRLLKTNGKMLWDETREYDVTPTPDGTESNLTRRYGERRKDGDLSSFALLDGETGDGIDADLVEDFHEDLTAQKSGRDGLSPRFFPFTSPEQTGYAFTLDGEETYRGRQVYRLRFEPDKKPRLRNIDDNLRIWEGELLVDQEEFQPVFVATQMALKIPLPLRLLFGISIRQLGFSVSYQRFGEDVWFPVSYGGEFRMKLFHFYKRNIIVSMVNENFRRAAVESDIQFEEISGH
jgi:hypothetical protein